MAAAALVSEHATDLGHGFGHARSFRQRIGAGNRPASSLRPGTEVPCTLQERQWLSTISSEILLDSTEKYGSTIYSNKATHFVAERLIG